MPLQQGAVKIQFVYPSARLTVEGTLGHPLEVISDPSSVCVCGRESVISSHFLIPRLTSIKTSDIMKHWKLNTHIRFFSVCMCVWWTLSTLISSGSSSQSAPPEMPLCRRAITPCLIPSTTAVYKSHYITVCLSRLCSFLWSLCLLVLHDLLTSVSHIDSLFICCSYSDFFCSPFLSPLCVTFLSCTLTFSLSHHTTIKVD